MGAIVNSIVVVITSLIGLLIGQRIPEKMNRAIMQGIGLVVITIGISGAVNGVNTLVLILSMVIGIVIGEGLDIHQRINLFIEKATKRLSGYKDQSEFTQAFMTATMLFCIGSMAIVGSLESGLTGDNATLYTKSVIDGISAVLFSSSLGIGVLFASIPLLLYQGSLIVFAQLLAPILSDAVILEMTTVGSVLLIGMGLNMLDITDFKMMNFIPAIFLPILLMLFL